VSARLNVANLDRVPRDARPGYDVRDLDIGIVHLGIGAFFRAHAAVYTDDVVASGDTRWGVLGASQRSPAVPRMLQPQDGLYTVLERPMDRAPNPRVIGLVRELVYAADDPEAVIARLTSPEVHVVTVTVTEKGYRADAQGRLRRDDEEIAADVGGRAPRTVIGQLARGLQRRAMSGGGPIALISCDNLTGNGALLRRLVGDFAERLPAAEADPLRDWIDRHVAFPATMVDRIVPAATEADRVEVEGLLGLRDDAVVVAEPLRQWVVANAFTGPRPSWERVGATLTDDVEAYERVKLRLLNATHSLIAYTGAVAGYRTIAEALADARIEGAARALMDEQMPTVAAPPGLDLAAYRDQVLRRFANPALRHKTVQVGMDGSQKLPQRVLAALRELRATGNCPNLAALTIAAWMSFLGGTTDDGHRLDVVDPLVDRLAPVVNRAASGEGITREVLTVSEVFGNDLADDGVVVELVAHWFTAFRKHGVITALAPFGR
jgi:fructuronate reductase